MNQQINEVLNEFAEELNILLEAKTVEEALYGLVAYLHNGLKIQNEVVLRFGDKVIAQHSRSVSASQILFRFRAAASSGAEKENGARSDRVDPRAEKGGEVDREKGCVDRRVPSGENAV